MNDRIEKIERNLDTAERICLATLCISSALLGISAAGREWNDALEADQSVVEYAIGRTSVLREDYNDATAAEALGAISISGLAIAGMGYGKRKFKRYIHQSKPE
ncbi:MAG TPA: hypothetical protein VF572_07270 [Candidatus Saccharimonadales bacterium]|jgi:hypothetical protein